MHMLAGVDKVHHPAPLHNLTASSQLHKPAEKGKASQTIRSSLPEVWRNKATSLPFGASSWLALKPSVLNCRLPAFTFRPMPVPTRFYVTVIRAALLSAAHQGRALNSLLLPLGQHDTSHQQHQKLELSTTAKLVHDLKPVPYSWGTPLW